MSTLSVQRIENVQDFDFANTPFVTAFNAANASFDASNAALATANAALPNVSNAVFAGDLRVTGNLLVGTSTVTIRTDHIISAEYYRMNTSNHMVVIPDGNRVNTIYSIANSAFDAANNVGPQIAPTFNTANAAFNTANAAYNSANNVAPQVTPAFNTANSAFDTANAAFASANNVAPQLAPAYNTANAAFAKANSALQNTNFTLAGNLTSTGVVTLNKFPFYESTANINYDYTINTGMNAFTPGPVAIANGVFVTIPDGSYWSVT